MLNLTSGRVIARIIGGKLDDELVYFDEKSEKGKNKMNLAKAGGTFVPSCDPNVDRFTYYFVGQAGSGKTVLTAQVAEEFRKIFKKVPIYLLSAKDKDKSIDYIKPMRIKIDDEFVTNPINWKDFDDGSMVIFDDIDILPAEQYDQCLFLLRQLLQGARDKNVWVITTMHMPTGGKKSSFIPFESQCIGYFPHGGAKMQTDNLLEKYIGLEKKEVKQIKKGDKKSRWICFYKNYPMMYLTQHTVGMVNNDSSDEE